VKPARLGPLNNASAALAPALALLLGVAVVASFRAPLADTFHRLRTRSDAYLLPPPDQVYVASLGYRSALADLIFGHVLVAYGLHFQEKRVFEHIGNYLETINRLDPKFRDPYRYADTLLTLQPKPVPVEYYRRARRIQERGLKELPHDQELWSVAGQFITFWAANKITDPKELREYRETGARYLMRACELIGSNQNIPYHCITAASLFNEQGNREASKQFLERVLTLSDDPNLRRIALNYLEYVAGAEARDRVRAEQERFQRIWQDDLPFSPRQELKALAPRFDPAACAGLARAQSPGCATSWAAWSGHQAEQPALGASPTVGTP
jgi:hypothetical protein